MWNLISQKCDDCPVNSVDILCGVSRAVGCFAGVSAINAPYDRENSNPCELRGNYVTQRLHSHTAGVNKAESCLRSNSFFRCEIPNENVVQFCRVRVRGPIQIPVPGKACQGARSTVFLPPAIAVEAEPKGLEIVDLREGCRRKNRPSVFECLGNVSERLG